MSEITGREIATAGMRAQSARMRVVMENVANAESTGTTPGSDPYRRKHLLFEPIDGRTAPRLRVEENSSPFPVRAIPGHPAADAAGLVKMPNVGRIMEEMDIRAAIGAYQKNLDVILTFEQVEKATLDLLKS